MQKWAFLALWGINNLYGASLETTTYNRINLHNKTGVNINVTATSLTNAPRFVGTMHPERSLLLEYPYTHGATFESLTVPKLSLAVQFGTLTKEEIAVFAIVLERTKLNIKPYVNKIVSFSSPEAKEAKSSKE
jgi:hypothetical protein